jgi:hypothetical protein
MHEDTWQALITPPSLILAGHALLFSFHFIVQEERKEKREREKLSSFCWPKIPWRKKTSIVALFQASLHQEKDSFC